MRGSSGILEGGRTSKRRGPLADREAPRPCIYLLQRAAAGETKRKAPPKEGRRAATKALAKRVLLLLGMLLTL
jgi:hypothetical protein